MYITVEQQINYLNRRIAQIDELKLMLSNNNLEAIYIIGHTLKGNGETFGYPEIGNIGLLIEEASLEKNNLKIKEAIDLLSLFLENNLTK